MFENFVGEVVCWDCFVEIGDGGWMDGFGVMVRYIDGVGWILLGVEICVGVF